uniref:Uncharacterized protein n=1 Tax=viral metagenome TaxID=1070528 RepID=A0A6H1ZT25_9ZZZZ
MAITFDAQSASAYSSTTTLTWSHICTGSDRLLVAGIYAGADSTMSVTYGGVSMTQINRLLMTGAAAGQYIYLFYLLSPATGANNVVSTSGTAVGMYGAGSSYAGAKQSAQPDASATQATATSQTTLTTSLTTVADNCWVVGHAYSGNAVTAGTNTTLRTGSVTALRMLDTNAAQTPAGSHSIQTTQTPAEFIGHCIASFAPIVSTTTKFNSNLSMLNVG